MDANEIIERRACITRRRAVRDRPAAVPRPAGAHARRLPRRDRATRASPPPTSTASRPIPGRWARPPASRGAGAYEVMDALRLKLRLVRQRARDVGPARLGDQRVPRGRVGPREPRAVLPLGLRGSRAGRQGPRRRSCPAAVAVAAARSRPRVHGVEPAVLARRRPRSGSRCSRSATSTSTARRASSWRGSRSTRASNAELNPKAIYRDPMSMDDYMDVAHDLDAVLPVRLRRAVRRRRPR